MRSRVFQTLLSSTFFGWAGLGVTPSRCERRRGWLHRTHFYGSSSLSLPSFLYSAAILITDRESACFLVFSLLPLSQRSSPRTSGSMRGQAVAKNMLPFPCRLRTKGVSSSQGPSCPAPCSGAAEPGHRAPTERRLPPEPQTS